MNAMGKSKIDIWVLGTLGFYNCFDAYCFLMLIALVSLMHHVFVGYAIDFSVALNYIACSNDHLLDKWSL